MVSCGNIVSIGLDNGLGKYPGLMSGLWCLRLVLSTNEARRLVRLSSLVEVVDREVFEGAHALLILVFTTDCFRFLLYSRSGIGLVPGDNPSK